MTREEFENIYRQHYAKMYRLARTMLYDVDESKDVVSDIFARLLRDCDGFARLLRDCDGPQKDKAASKREQSDACISSVEREQARPKAKMEGYLMTAVRNRCRDVLCHKSMQERVEKLFLQESMQCQIVSMNDDDRLERLMQFIEAELPPLSQQIFRLRFLSEMSYEEVAQAAGVSKVTVYNHLSQSVQRIKEYFQQQTAKR